jgi:hypothetical protein
MSCVSLRAFVAFSLHVSPLGYVFAHRISRLYNHRLQILDVSGGQLSITRLVDRLNFGCRSPSLLSSKELILGRLLNQNQEISVI